MLGRVCVLVIAVILAWPAPSRAQMASEELIHSYFLGELQRYTIKRATQATMKTGLNESEARAAAVNASQAVIECFMTELELIAMTNNIDRTLFMDSLAFAIVWGTEQEFINQLEGVKHFGEGARQCLQKNFESRGINIKR